MNLLTACSPNAISHGLAIPAEPGNSLLSSAQVFSGAGGIRTLGTVTRTQHFQCCTIDHSVTAPWVFRLPCWRTRLACPWFTRANQDSGRGCLRQLRRTRGGSGILPTVSNSPTSASSPSAPSLPPWRCTLLHRESCTMCLPCPLPPYQSHGPSPSP